jgi:hypothetical protein
MSTAGGSCQAELPRGWSLGVSFGFLYSIFEYTLVQNNPTIRLIEYLKFILIFFREQFSLKRLSYFSVDTNDTLTSYTHSDYGKNSVL